MGLGKLLQQELDENGGYLKLTVGANDLETRQTSPPHEAWPTNLVLTYPAVLAGVFYLTQAPLPKREECRDGAVLLSRRGNDHGHAKK